MVADISLVGYFAPIAAFVIVFAVVYAVLLKTKIIGESAGAIAFVSLLFAVVFVSVAGARDFVSVMTPWFVVVLLSFVFLLAMIGFGKSFFGEKGGISDGSSKGLVWVFIIIVGIVFIASFFVVFSSQIAPYVPGPEYGLGADERTLFFTDWLFSGRVRGALALIVVGAIAFWVLVKSAGSSGGGDKGKGGDKGESKK